jgi:hypothetical protein
MRQALMLLGGSAPGRSQWPVPPHAARDRGMGVRAMIPARTSLGHPGETGPVCSSPAPTAPISRDEGSER